MTYPPHIAARAAEKAAFASTLNLLAVRGMDTPEAVERAYRGSLDGERENRRQFLRRLRRKYGGAA